MVALKAELGPRDTAGTNPDGSKIPIRPGYDVFVAAGADALPGTGTALGTFEHNSPTDPLDIGLNHAVVHHVQSILYRREQNTPANVTPPAIGPTIPPAMYTGNQPIGSMFPINFTDASILRIKRHGATMLSTGLTAVAVSMAPAATATLVLKLQPGDVAAANADHTFASNNTSIATVAATGVVTGVAPGQTQIHVVNRFNGLIVDVPVTVTGATAFGFEVRMVEENGQQQMVQGTRKAEAPDDDKKTVEQPAVDDAEEAETEDEEVPVTDIIGIGPAMEARLAEAGIVNARQIAELSEEEVAELDEKLGLGGRIERDDWVGQAQKLID